ncbi:MAG: MFS transporter [Promethearchaeota archaeon]|nr:MAG: MFS transporter [Candidatus Lokiarchaeota archaeon]
MSKLKIKEKFKVPLKYKIEFAVGGVGFNLSAGFFAAWLTNFYLKVVEVNLIFWAIAWGLYLVWNSINDPLVGYFGDATRTRLGRRKPWLIIATPFITIAYILLFFPPILDPTLLISQFIYFIWLLATLLFYDTFYTIIGIMQRALVAELSILPEERTSSNLYWSIGTLFGQVVTFALPFLFIVNEDPYSQNLPIFQILVLIFSLFGFGMLLIMSLGIGEKKEFAHYEKDRMKFKESILYTIRNKGFIIFTLFNFMLVFVSATIYSQVSFFVQDVLQIPGSNLISILPLTAFIGASLLGYPIATFLNKKYGGKKTIIYLSFPVIGSLIALTFAFEFVSSNILIFIMGLGYSGMILITPMLMADVIDKDELKTGRRREGAYYGSSSLFTKPAQSASAAIIALVFALTGYIQGQAEQDLLAQFGIKLTIGLIPAIFIIIGVVVLLRFPIDGSTKEYKKWKENLENLHDTKRKKYLDEVNY